MGSMGAQQAQSFHVIYGRFSCDCRLIWMYKVSAHGVESRVHPIGIHTRTSAWSWATFWPPPSPKGATLLQPDLHNIS
jgi:hypothetical protein